MLGIRASQSSSGSPALQLRVSRLFENRFGGVWLALILFGGVSLLTRAALLAQSAREVAWNPSLLASFAWGALFDIAAAVWWLAPFGIGLALVPRRWLNARATRWLAHGTFLGLLYAALFGAVAEWIFWDEFGVRFNFIAVDYLVYTKEVIGNIRESYPMPLIYAGLLAPTTFAYFAFCRTGWVKAWLDSVSQPVRGRTRWEFAAAMVGAVGVFGMGLQQRFIPEFANTYNRELAKNGLWSLFAAFRDNQLEYDRFYSTLPLDHAFARVHTLLAGDGALPAGTDSRDLLRLIRHEGGEKHFNVIQITVESLSADFLSTFNHASKLTPNLEQLARQSLVFDQFYATGTRTDRGMEALTLSVPPTPGRSLVKRPDHGHLFTLGSVFRNHGYETAFIYGGFGYFDNMNHFFGENGYRVIDRAAVAKNDVTFANVWGACDEDLYRWTLREADRDHGAGKPFFYFVMTTSNHRPFTYPDGKIDLPSKLSGRSGAVKYSDYAIGQLIREAATRPWYKDTVFVIVGDHCASSAGKSDLPLQNYRIPLIVFAPGGQIKTGTIHTIASQIDYAPTLLGLLNWNYPSRFYGHDLLDASKVVPGRALLGNYQKLGLYQNGKLTVLSPVRQSHTYEYEPATHDLTSCAPDQAMIDDTIAYYQTASWLFKNGRQSELLPQHVARNSKASPAPVRAARN